MSDAPKGGCLTECAECKVVDRHRVIETRPIGGPSLRTNRRRKECPVCEHRYTTYEIPADRYFEVEEVRKWRALFGDYESAKEMRVLIRHLSAVMERRGNGEVEVESLPVWEGRSGDDAGAPTGDPE